AGRSSWWCRGRRARSSHPMRESAMKYVLLLMGNLTDDRCGEGEEGPGVEEFMAFDAELERAGVLAGGFRLTDPEEGTSLSKATREAEPVTTAGPYAESREFVGGTVVID